MVEGGIGEMGDKGIGGRLGDRLRDEIVGRVGKKIGGGIGDGPTRGLVEGSVIGVARSMVVQGSVEKSVKGRSVRCR